MGISEEKHTKIEFYKGFNHTLNHLLLKKVQGDYLIIILCEKRIKNIIKSQSLMNYLNSSKNSILLVDDYINDIPTFYLGVNGKETVTTDLISLINSISKDEDFESQRIIVCGHGRAGTSSIILGEKIKAKYIISSFPEITLDELNEGRGIDNEILEFVVGNEDNNSKDILEQLLQKKVLKNEKFQAEIYILGDPTDSSMKKIIDKFDINKQIYHLETIQNYDKSETLFLKKILNEKIELVRNDMIIKKPECEYKSDENFILKLNLINFEIESMDVAVYFYSKTKWIKAINYNKDLFYNIDLDLNLVDSIKVFVKKGKRVLDVKRYVI